MCRSLFPRAILAIAVAASSIAPIASLPAKGQTPAVAAQSPDKLPVRLKAKLPDYKGPSKFIGRKALIMFSTDGHLVAMSGMNGTITIWDTETGELKAKLKAGSAGISGFSFSPDGQTAGTRDYLDKSVKLWDVKTWQEKATLTGRKRNLETKLKAGLSFEEEFGPVAFSPDGKTVLSEKEDDLVAVWDVAAARQLFELNHNTTSSVTKEILKGIFLPRSSAPHFLVLQTGFSSDGRWIFTINGDKSAKIWDASTGKLKSDITNNERIYRAGFSPDSTMLITVEQEGGMKLWDLETGQLQGKVAPKGYIENLMKSFEFSPDSKYVATFFFGDTRLWDAKTAELKFKLPKSGTTDATFAPDGRWLATASSDKQSAGKIWNVETGEAKLTLPSTGDKSVSLIFNPDGTILATTNDKGVYLWDAASGELLATLSDARYPVAFSSDGRTMVTGARKDTALLWEVPARTKQ
ncbi:MAG: WD40 repeat domain-containing protein [Pyrinomonadaceae bacterium]